MIQNIENKPDSEVLLRNVIKTLNADEAVIAWTETNSGKVHYGSVLFGNVRSIIGLLETTKFELLLECNKKS